MWANKTTTGRKNIRTVMGPQRGSSCCYSRNASLDGREIPPATHSSAETPLTMVWVCTHLLRSQLSCGNSSGTATRRRAKSFNKRSSCVNRACMWERVGMCIFKYTKTPTSRSLNTGRMIFKERRKMCWFPLQLDRLLQIGQLIQEQLRKMWSTVVSNFRVVLILVWPVRGPVLGEVLGTLWRSNRL